MSADNWAICPRCKRRAENASLALAQKAAESYGQVPAEQYEAMMAEARVPIDVEKLRTFREDYEFYGADEGTVTAVYGGSCNVCHLKLEFKHVHLIPGVMDD